jgi:hypothetical protein
MIVGGKTLIVGVEQFIEAVLSGPGPQILYGFGLGETKPLGGAILFTALGTMIDE